MLVILPHSISFAWVWRRENNLNKLTRHTHKTHRHPHMERERERKCANHLIFNLFLIIWHVHTYTHIQTPKKLASMRTHSPDSHLSETIGERKGKKTPRENPTITSFWHKCLEPQEPFIRQTLKRVSVGTYQKQYSDNNNNSWRLG